MLKLALSVVTVYHLWRAQNDIVFSEKRCNAIAPVGNVVKEIQILTSTWKGFLRNQTNWMIALEWSLSHGIICLV